MYQVYTWERTAPERATGPRGGARSRGGITRASPGPGEGEEGWAEGIFGAGTLPTGAKRGISPSREAGRTARPRRGAWRPPRPPPPWPISRRRQAGPRGPRRQAPQPPAPGEDGRRQQRQRSSLTRNSEASGPSCQRSSGRPLRRCSRARAMWRDLPLPCLGRPGTGRGGLEVIGMDRQEF